MSEAQDFVCSLVEIGPGEIVAFTGAGISTESGIPDFRSPGGIWSKMQPIQYQDFVRDEKSRLEDWRRRFEMQTCFQKARPNAAHRALAGLANSGQLGMIITQNVDGLHQVSGVPGDKLIELHGNSTYATCLDCGARAALEDQRSKVAARQTPECEICGGLLKAAVVSFGQAMPQIALARAESAAQQARVFLVIGSSLVVHPAAQLPIVAVKSGAELVIINRDPTPLDAYADKLIRTPIAKTLGSLTDTLGF
nr:Sir2 family NAD-dependent protein deacetylase [Roseibium sp. RKSG952]